MAKKTVKKKQPAAGGDRLVPAPGTVVVRMYRIGHGDCFLLAFPGQAAGAAAYVLIDCGYKPGSNAAQFIDTTAKEITSSIRAATGGHIDVAVVTHEHQDHVNAISQTNFKDITIGEAWFAWTEDPDDDVANDLRKEFKDKLLGLLAARNRLAADGDAAAAAKLDNFLAFELGGEEEKFNAGDALNLLAADDPLNSLNKKSMKLFKDRASNGTKFLRPHSPIRKVPGTDGVRVFVLGPPRGLEQLKNLDPEGDEEFHLAMSSPMAYFGAAARAGADRSAQVPFAGRYCVPMSEASTIPLFVNHYGKDGDPPLPSPSGTALEVATNAEWRRIDRDWLYSAEQLALDMSDYTNNSSLVLAFELEPGGKVLLFAADAQRGNWRSWTKKGWTDGGTQVTTKDLLSRTVLYKVGHHGSHNATLNGTADADYANIGWMAHGDHGREFTAMITAVRKWAETQDGWDHPLKAIKDALLQKAAGRVFQTDTDFDKMTKPGQATEAEWNQFKARTVGDKLYFDYTISIG